VATAVLVVRDPSRGWSDPAFYTVAAGSLGLQLGGQVSETVFTVMNDRALNALIDNQFKFGGDISVAAGPSGKRTGSSATTNFRFRYLFVRLHRGVVRAACRSRAPAC
jgi:lipid-binding SYLF domain-containing protein